VCVVTLLLIILWNKSQLSHWTKTKLIKNVLPPILHWFEEAAYVTKSGVSPPPPPPVFKFLNQEFCFKMPLLILLVWFSSVTVSGTTGFRKHSQISQLA